MNTKPRSRSSRDALEALGLTPLEADIYAFLARESPASGYRIAQALGRPVSNIYKAVESLEDKGAVMTADDDGTRVARAVPIAEVAARLRRQLDSAADDAAAALDSPEDPAGDWALYRLTDRDSVLERARAMLASAQKLAVALITPALADALAPDLAAAARRVPVGLKVFRPIDIPSATTILDPRGPAAVDSGPGQYLSLNTDGSFYLQALFDPTGEHLHLAHWSANPLLAWTTYTGIAHAIRLAALDNQLAAGADSAALRAALDADLPHETSQSLGKLNLTNHYRDAPRPRRRSSPS
jgi:HTH-type transcriptional regulator, sugar sensing transcriptional regulator